MTIFEGNGETINGKCNRWGSSKGEHEVEIWEEDFRCQLRIMCN